MIVDVHTHLPEDLFDQPQTFLGMLRAGGVDRAVISGSHILYKLGRAAEHNDRLADFCRRTGGAVVPLATVHLTEGAAAVAEACRCLETLGVHGFKVHPWLQGESLALPALADLCQLAAEFGVPILFHDGTPCYSLPAQIGLLAEQFPATPLVLGHGGILHYWREALEVTRRRRNVYITLCGQHPWAMQAICDAIGPERVMWGSDFGYGVVPDILRYRMGLAEGLRLSAEARTKIMGQTARALFRMDRPGPAAGLRRSPPKKGRA